MVALAALFEKLLKLRADKEVSIPAKLPYIFTPSFISIEEERIYSPFFTNILTPEVAASIAVCRSFTASVHVVPLPLPVASLSTYKILLASGVMGAGSVTSADAVAVHPLASVMVTEYVPAVNPVKSSVVAVWLQSKP